MDFICIVNPVSGRGQATGVAEKLKQRLEQDGHRVRIQETMGDSEAFQEICDQITLKDRVICIGGDGTLLYFLNHCKTFHSVAFYGMGTANVLSIEFNIPRRIEKFVKMLEDDYTVSLHPGMTNDGDRFLMMCSFGLDGRVLKRVRQSAKNKIGKVAFFWPLLRSALFYRYPKRMVTVDGRHSFNAVFAVASRTKHYGGPFRIAPDASPQKNYFEVVAMEKGGPFWTMLMFLYLIVGRIAHCPGVRIVRGDHVAISGDGAPVYFQMDGDLYQGDVHELTVGQETFPMVVPQPQLA